MSYEIIAWDSMDIDSIQPTWEELTIHHAETSKYFNDFFSNYPFEVRKSKLIKGAVGGKIKIDLLIDSSTKSVYGHCLSIIREDLSGELESLYIKPIARGFAFGKELVERAMIWFESEGVDKIGIEVAVGNDHVLSFYQKFGYYTFSYNLKKINKK